MRQIKDNEFIVGLSGYGNPNQMNPSIALEAYSVIFLRCEDRYLLLQRDQSKSFAPGRWTGIGGHVEPDEYGRLYESALRELNEETGFNLDDVDHFFLRRVLFIQRPGQNLTLLCYFTGTIALPILPNCPEGTLAWKSADEFVELDIIETTHQVLNRLVEDLKRDPTGSEEIRTGLGVFRPDGQFEKVIWG